MNEKDEFMEFIKEVQNLQPEKDFVDSTETKLRQIIQKQELKRRYVTIPTLLSAIIISFAALFLFFVTDSRMKQEVSTISEQSKNNSSWLYKESAVLIYHTHNQESFQPEFNDVNDKVVDETLNITLVGKRLADSLEKLQIRTIHDTTDYTQISKERGFPFQNAYILSRETVKQVLANNKQILVIADIHRDSVSRDVSTLENNGITYAKIELILSKNSTLHEENMLFAQSLHLKLEEAFPGLSRGILLKESQPISADYNQDLFGNTVLISIGGVENTLEEEYRTADILAQVLQKQIIEETTKQYHD